MSSCTYKGFPALLVPALTPFASDLDPDAMLFASRCKKLLGNGADGLAVFGTTSESNSLSLDERMSLLEALVKSGIDAGALMPGCATCAFPDTVKLVSHALSLGCPGVLLMPPFFYRVPGLEGMYSYYAKVIDKVGDDRLSIYLYHFPQMSGMPITLELMGKLSESYPNAIAGVKDSSGEWNNTEAMIKGFPDLDIFTGSEGYLLSSLKIGGAGCISATANVNSSGIRSLIDSRNNDDAGQKQEAVNSLRTLFEQYPMIPALKSYLAATEGQGWSHMRPPLVPLGKEDSEKLLVAVREAMPDSTVVNA